MNSIGKLIKQARLQKGLTLEQVGKAVGVGKSTVLKWESGAISNMKRDKIAALAQILGISPAVIMGWDEPTTTSSEIDVFQYDNIFPITTQKLPMLGDIACGQPIFANEDRESYVEVGTNIKADFCLRAKGDSMINARIRDGDIIFIKKQPSVENGEIAAVIIDDQATLKRVFLQPDKEQLMLVAENTAYAPLVFIGEELNHIHILGKAVAFQGDVK